MEYCTLFAIAGTELDPSGDSLAGYDDASTGRTPVTNRDTALELGTAWTALHAALGKHGADHPLGFLDAGGELRSEFAGPSSNGRYFDFDATVKLLAALARMPSPSREIERLRVFIADTVAADRGVIVHHFR
ncbi:MAG TPA: hypothetical protein VGF94_08205 [Kofleriaceae bacterium]|jgi:hypothetical protein